MKLTVKSGSALAATAAMLLLSGAAANAAEEKMDGAKGHCIGANSCKGTSACKTATSECGGKNACKGKGFLEKTKAECDKIEGAKFEAAAAKEEMKDMKEMKK